MIHRQLVEVGYYKINSVLIDQVVGREKKELSVDHVVAVDLNNL